MNGAGGTYANVSPRLQSWIADRRRDESGITWSQEVAVRTGSVGAGGGIALKPEGVEVELKSSGWPLLYNARYE